MEVTNTHIEPARAAQASQPSRQGIVPGGGPSIAPSPHGYFPLIQPTDRVISGQELDIRRIPPRQVLEYAFTHSHDVESLKHEIERAPHELGIGLAIQRAPKEALEYLVWAGALGHQHHTLVEGELSQRRSAASSLAGSSDERLDTVMVSFPGTLRTLAQREKARSAEVRRLVGIQHAMQRMGTVAFDPALREASGEDLQALAHGSPDQFPLERRAAALKEWQRRRTDPDSVLQKCQFGEHLPSEVVDYATLHSNELKALIPRLNDGSLTEVQTELRHWPDEALTCLGRHADVLTAVHQLINDEVHGRHVRAGELAGLSLQDLRECIDAATGPQKTLAQRELTRRIDVGLLSVQAATILGSFSTAR